MRACLPDLADELGTTDRTLRRALRQGLLRGARPSPRNVELAVGERAYLVRAWPLLSSLREALRTEPTVSLAVLFGSRARGDEATASDVDLLVGLRPGSSPRRLATRLGEKVGLRVQVATVEDARAAPLLLAEALREARVLVDRDRAWPALLGERARIERAAHRERGWVDAAFTDAFGGGSAG